MHHIFTIQTEKDKKLPLQLCTAGYTTHQNAIHRKTGLSMHQLLLVASGRGKLEVQGKIHELKAGSLFYLPPALPHAYYPCKGEDLYTTWIGYNGLAATAFNDFFGIDGHSITHLADFGKAKDVFSHMYRTTKEHPHAEFLSDEGYHAVYRLLQMMHHAALPISDSVQSAITFMTQNLQSDISLEQIATAAGTTKYALCRSFKAECGYTVFSYLQSLRIQYAKKMLTEDSSKGIAAVSKQCGFRSVSYFCAVFKEEVGQTPRQYRSMMGF